jgi:hypothetical protein
MQLTKLNDSAVTRYTFHCETDFTSWCFPFCIIKTLCEDGYFLRYCIVLSGRYRQRFQTSLPPPSSWWWSQQTPAKRRSCHSTRCNIHTRRHDNPVSMSPTVHELTWNSSRNKHRPADRNERYILHRDLQFLIHLIQISGFHINSRSSGRIPPWIPNDNFQP